MADNVLNLDMTAWLDSFESLERQMPTAKAQLLSEQGNKMHRQVKLLTPVDSGNLRRSWAVALGSDEVEVSTYLEYAEYVEDGHNQKARFVPGRWSGNRFIYDPNARTGMMLKAKWIAGRKMVEKTMHIMESELDSDVARWFNDIIANAGF